MNGAHAALVALTLALLVLSLPLSLRDEPYSSLNDAELGHWFTAGPTGARVTETGAPARFLTGPLHDLEEGLLVVAPRVSYSKAEVDAFRTFIAGGGRAIIADDTGSARALVDAVGAHISEAWVFSTSYDRSPAFPIATATGALPGTGEAVLSRPHAVLGAGEPVLVVHANSWLDTDSDLRPDLGEERGAWAVARLVPYGAGAVLVIADPDVFTPAGDALAGLAGPALAWLGDVAVDEGHRARADPVGTAPLLSGAAPVRMALLCGLVLAGMLAVGLRVRVRRTTAPVRPSRLETRILDELR